MPTNTTVRIGYVPEHYLLPLHLAHARNKFLFPVELIPFPSGTGHMITSLRSAAIDIGIGLTEGWVAGLLTAPGPVERGYRIVGSWVQSPLRWAIVTGRNRDEINAVSDLRNHRRVGVSRIGSGSHIMAFVLAQREGWLDDGDDDESSSSPSPSPSPSALAIVPSGPFADLRDAVTGPKNGEAPPTADFFMWEHFTTKPYFHSTTTASPLKRIGEIYTPWPSWHIAASTSSFADPDHDQRLGQLFQALDQGILDFRRDPDEAVRLLGTGELGCHYSEEDAREWLRAVRFAERTRGVDAEVMANVVHVLKSAGVVDQGVSIQDGDGVIGIHLS